MRKRKRVELTTVVWWLPEAVGAVVWGAAGRSNVGAYKPHEQYSICLLVEHKKLVHGTIGTVADEVARLTPEVDGRANILRVQVAGRNRSRQVRRAAAPVRDCYTPDQTR